MKTLMEVKCPDVFTGILLSVGSLLDLQVVTSVILELERTQVKANLKLDTEVPEPETEGKLTLRAISVGK